MENAVSSNVNDLYSTTIHARIGPVSSQPTLDDCKFLFENETGPYLFVDKFYRFLRSSFRSGANT